MNKRICDICEKNEANNSFRIQEEKEVCNYSTFGFPIPKKEWTEIDICEECFKKMKTIKDYKKLEERIYDEAIAGWHQIYGDDETGAVNYLMGVEAALRAIDPKIQFDTERIINVKRRSNG